MDSSDCFDAWDPRDRSLLASRRGVSSWFRSSELKRAEILVVVGGGFAWGGLVRPPSCSCCMALKRVEFRPPLSRAEDLVAADVLEGCEGTVDPDAGSPLNRRRFADVLGSDRI